MKLFQADWGTQAETTTDWQSPLLWLDRSIFVPNDGAQRGALDTTLWLEKLSTNPSLITLLLRHGSRNCTALDENGLHGCGHAERKGEPNNLTELLQRTSKMSLTSCHYPSFTESRTASYLFQWILRDSCRLIVQHSRLFPVIQRHVDFSEFF